MPSAATTALRRAATGTGATLVLTAAAVGVATPAHADAQYTVQRGDTVSHIAARTGVPVARIAAANHLTDPSYIRAGQVLTIPTSAAAVAPAAAPAAVPAATTYTVARGDTVSGIAKKFGTTVTAIATANSLADPSRIRAGQALTVPGVAAASAAAPTAAMPTVSAGYTVARGDTLSGIAKKFGTTVTAIATANSLADPSRIRAGQALTVPGVAAAAMPTVSAGYTVARGDTLGGIAKKFGTTVTAIATANSLADPSRIRAGQALTIPGVQPTATTTPLVADSFAGRTYPGNVVSAANANRATLLAIGAPTKDQVRALVASTATAMGVDPALALAVAYQESGFDHTQVSPANAIGAMQVIPSSGQWASELVGRDLNLLDPVDNAVAGVAILRTLLRTSPDLPTAIASYYQGQTSVKRNGMFADTRQYVASVQALLARFA